MTPRKPNAKRGSRPSERLRRNNTSGVAGVHFDATKQRWVAKIGDRKLGRFKAKSVAARARAVALESR